MELYVYSICLGVGVLFTLASVVFGHMLGGGHDVHFDGGHVTGAGGHAETGLQNSDMPGVSPFSPTVIASFVAAFGGLGIIFHEIPATRAVWFRRAVVGGWRVSDCRGAGLGAAQTFSRHAKFQRIKAD